MNKIEDTFNEFMMNHDVEDSEAVKKANENVVNYLCLLAGKDKSEIEDMVSYAGYEREKQGFINGFQYAILMNSALQKGGAAI